MSSHRAAVLGSPIGHSLSPVLHTAAYQALGLTDWRYERHAVGGPGEPALAEFLTRLGPDWAGLSLTMPLKETALAVASGLSARARRVEAANTLLPRGNGWYADSTDAVGLRVALQAAGLTRPGRAVLLGAGATARSALDALAELGCDDVIVGVRGQVRTETAALAERLGLRLHPVSLSQALDHAGDVDVVISTLPGGTPLPLPTGTNHEPAGGSSSRSSATVVLDVVYADWPTPLARWAAAEGAVVISGLRMLIYQAAEQVRLMTGRSAPVAAMSAAVLQRESGL